MMTKRLDVADIADRYKIGVSAKNLLNDRYITSIFLLQGLGGYRYSFYNPPRWISVDATIKF